MCKNRLEPTAISSEYKYSKRRMFSSDPGERADESKVGELKTDGLNEKVNEKVNETNEKAKETKEKGKEKVNETTEKSEEELNEIQRLIKNKLDYNHNGLIMSGVDNSTVILLAKIQAREQKRSSERSLARRELFLSSRNNFHDDFQRNSFDNLVFQRNLRENLRESLRENLRGKSTKALIEDYLSHRLLKRKVRQNARQQSSRTIIIDQPSQSLARVTFNFVGNRLVKSLPAMHSNKSGRYSGRQARLLSEDGVVLDHLLLGKSFVLQKN